ncbi:MAG: ABC transporter ATP-binding protein/permease [Myxococcota bacterium]|nr:ABC transporter ATP-binding protein/permease [Myxococcota bacterium]
MGHRKSLTDDQGDHEPPGPRSGVAWAADLELLLLRVAELSGVHRDVSRAREAAVIASLDDRATGVDHAPLGRALESIGLRMEPMRGPLALVLQRVGPGAPLVVRGETGSRGRWLILSDRAGGRTRVEDVATGEARWLGRRKLAAAVGGGDEITALAIDSALALAPMSSSARHHDGSVTPLRRLAALARLDRHDVMTIVVYSVAVGILGLTTPLAVQAMVSTVAFGTFVQPLIVLATLLLVALGTSSLFRGVHSYVVETLQQRFFVRVVADLAYRLPRVRREALDGRHGPELVNRFFDVFTVQKAAASLLVGGLELILAAIVGMAVLAFYHPLLLALDVVLMVVVAAIGLGPWARGTTTAIDESKKKYEIASWLQELARHDVELKLAGGLRYAEERASELARRYIESRRAHFRVAHGQLVAMLAVQAVASAAVLGLGGWLVIERQLTLGQLVAAELVVTIVVASLAKLGRYVESGYDALAGLDKLGHLIDLPIERAGGDACPIEGPAALALEGVRAGYAGVEVLTSATVSIDPGDRVAITGPAGSGKSLLVELLGGLRAPQAGRVVMHGRDLRDLDLESVRERIAVVTRPAVIEGSVLDNVRMGREGIDRTRAREALAAVGLEEELEALAEGAHTMLGIDGAPLSRTQALRLTLARAIAARPSLLVVDHLLDGLDDEALEPVLSALTDVDAPWTLVVVTQDPRVRQRCTRGVRLEDGMLEEVPS